MKIRLLKKIIEPLRESTELEKATYKLAKKGFYVSIISIAISSLGIFLIMKQIRDSADRTQFESLLTKINGLLSKDSELTQKSIQQTNSLIDINNNISAQLNLSRIEQTITNTNFGYSENANENAFYVATQNLQMLQAKRLEPLFDFYKNNNIGLSEYWNANRLPYIIEASSILQGQLNNPFLLSNKDMLQEWQNAYRLTYLYEYMTHSIHEGSVIENAPKEVFGKCLDAIGFLTMRTYLYMTIRINDKYNNTKPKPGELHFKTYKEVVEYCKGKPVKEIKNK